MKKYLYMAVAAIAALSSCSSDNDPGMGETGKQALIFTATMEGSETRATYDSEFKCASWEEGDIISINGKQYSAQSAGLTTTFEAENYFDPAVGPTYNAYFACIGGDLPELHAAVNETWVDGKFNMPMYATSTTTDLKFKNLCGVLKITVKSDQIDAVKRIKVSSANRAISDEFTVVNNAAVLKKPDDVGNTFTVTYTTAVPTTAEGTVFYVAVPAQTYQELRIRLDADGNGFTKSMTTKARTDITVERNKIYPITFAHNGAAPTSEEGTTGKANAIIDGENVEVNWVQLWENGPKFAEYDAGASKSAELGEEMTFAEAAAEGDDYVWGENWRTPSKNEMNELFLAATGTGSTKVECDYVQKDGQWGLIFTGKKEGYTGNSVFFPAKLQGYIDEARFYYWTSTVSSTNNDKAWYVILYYHYGGWGSKMYETEKSSEYRVRPVFIGDQDY